MQDIAEFIAGQLKDLFNLAFIMIEEKRYEDAKNAYQNAATLSEVAGYTEGVKMAFMSLANLYILQDDCMEAFSYARLAKKSVEQNANLSNKDVDELLGKLALSILKQGIELEKNQEYDKAYSIFEMILPYLGIKRAAVVQQEMKVLEKYRVRIQEEKQ